MTLNEYLYRSRRGEAKAMAEGLGVAERTIRNWRYGDAMPRPAMIERIEKWTEGAVRPQDWFGTMEAAE